MMQSCLRCQDTRGEETQSTWKGPFSYVPGQLNTNKLKENKKYGRVVL